MVSAMNVSSKTEEYMSNDASNAAAAAAATELEEEQGEDGSVCAFLINVAGLLFVLSLLMAFVAVFVLSIHFLVYDYGAGGPCANTYGHHIWVYFLIKLCVGCCSQMISAGTVRGDGDDEGEDATNGVVVMNKKQKSLSKDTVSGIVLVLLINIGILVYGGVVLVHDPVCVEYTHTGLYKMAYAMFFIDSSLIFCMSMAGLLKCCRDDTSDRDNQSSGDGGEGQIVKNQVHSLIDIA